ncbi:MAG: hypothetical protein V1855_02585 [bacterium]
MEVFKRLYVFQCIVFLFFYVQNVPVCRAVTQPYEDVKKHVTFRRIESLKQFRDDCVLYAVFNVRKMMQAFKEGKDLTQIKGFNTPEIRNEFNEWLVDIEKQWEQVYPKQAFKQEYLDGKDFWMLLTLCLDRADLEKIYFVYEEDGSSLIKKNNDIKLGKTQFPLFFIFMINVPGGERHSLAGVIPDDKTVIICDSNNTIEPEKNDFFGIVHNYFVEQKKKTPFFFYIAEPLGSLDFGCKDNIEVNRVLFVDVDNCFGFEHVLPTYRT